MPEQKEMTNNASVDKSDEVLIAALKACIPSSTNDATVLWAGKANALLESLLPALIELRDKGEVQFSASTVREHMLLQKFIALAERDDLDPKTTDALCKFLSDCGWHKGMPEGQQSTSLAEHFCYTRSYFGVLLHGLTEHQAVKEVAESAAENTETSTRVHHLKTDPALFQASLEGNKPYEVRLNDRSFRPGDLLVLNETLYAGEEMRNGKPLIYTGRVLSRWVTEVRSNYGMLPGWCILGVRSA